VKQVDRKLSMIFLLETKIIDHGEHGGVIAYHGHFLLVERQMIDNLSAQPACGIICTYNKLYKIY
jgi:hypothetical protein